MAAAPRAAARAPRPAGPACAGSGVEPQAEASQATTCYSDSFDDCPWVWVERDTLGFCVENVNGLLRLRVSAHVDGIDDLCVSLCPRREGGAVWDSVQWRKPILGKFREVTLSVPPLERGPHTAEIRFQFVKSQRILKFKSTAVLFVYPSESSAKQIAESIVFNITNDIKTGHASDVHLSQDAADAIGKFTHNENAHSLTELLNLMKSDQRAFRREEFYEAGCEKIPDLPTPPPDAALAKRLTLCVGGRLLHLLADRRVTLGKNRANGIVTRLFDPGGAVSEKRSERISRYHCTLELDGGDCVIHDGALDEAGRMKASAWGVFWQGKAVHGSLRVPAVSFQKKAAALGLAGSGAESDFGLTVQGFVFGRDRCASCENPAARACLRGENPAVLLRRTDPIPESYVLLWSCLDLGRVFPELEGVAVCYEQGAFSCRSTGSFGWLVPGFFAPGGTGIAVRSFSQYGL